MTILVVIILVVMVIIILYSVGKSKSNDQKTTDNRTIVFKAEVVTDSGQTKEERQEYENYIKKYPKWYGVEKIKSLCYKESKIEPLPINTTETVKYKTDRYAELFGRGKDCSYFPGYGKIFNRTFEIWHQEFGSKERQGQIDYMDIGTDREPPFFTEEITEGHRIYNGLLKTQGFLKLYNVRVEKTRKTWYAGLKDLEFTGLITDKQIKEDE